MPNNIFGPIHALCLQLVATGIVELKVSEEACSMTGTNDLSAKGVVVRLDVNHNMPRCLEDESGEDDACC